MSAIAMSSAFLSPSLSILAEGFRATVRQQAVSSDLAAILEYHYPVSVHYLTPLTTETVARWLARYPLPLDFGERGRALYGCVISVRGQGFIFVESAAPAAEQSYTLAHEFAHFLRDHHAPRQQTMEQFGAAIREVLDGERSPTPSERLEAVLRGTSLRLFRHLMLRDGDGQPLGVGIQQAEIEADLLAVELIAPYRELLQALPHPARTQQRFHELLMAHYQLPADIAHRYATQLAAHFGTVPSVRTWLGMDS